MKKMFLFLLFMHQIICYSQLRVTGGSAIDIKQVPWQALLRGDAGTCGGSIISPRYILTAKHCVADVKASNIRVNAGISLRSNASSKNEYRVSSVIIHPTYDVALLKLSTSIVFDDTKRSINFAESMNDRYYANCTEASVSGWGWLKPKSNALSEQLQAVGIHIISNEDAAAMLGMPVYDHEVAAIGSGNVRQGACHGDSGGPLVVWSDLIGDYVLVGVVSRGRTECVGDNTNSPSIFIRVSNIYKGFKYYRMGVR